MYGLTTPDRIRAVPTGEGAVQGGDPGGDVGQELDAARERAEGLLDSTLEALPRIGIALGVLLVAWLVSLVVRRLLERRWRRSRSPSFARVMSRLVGWVVLTVGLLAGMTVAFPSVDPVDVVAGLGVVSIAAGFAFQDILSNMMSGLLLITRQPFVTGDQVRIGEHEGTVEGITIRETQLETYQGRYVQVPNRDVYQNAIIVQTAKDAVRTDLVVGCSYEDDLELVSRTALAAVESAAGVRQDPAPVARFAGFGESSIDLELRYWSDPRQAEQVDVRHNVVIAVKAAFDDAGLVIPWPIRTLDASDSVRTLLAGEAAS